MSGIGSGKSSKGGGAKSRSKGGKGDALHKKVSIQTSKEHLTTLRLALRDELGHDRDIISGFGAFTKYDRNDLALDIHFRTGSTITDEELEWAYELVSSNLGPLGHKWKPQALMDDLCDPSSRYALVTERASAAPAEKKPASKGKGKKKSSAPPIGKPVAFAHFRFTVQGETREAMEGEPVLMLRDLHVESDYQRKGLGKHLCQLLELSARKHAMRAMMMIVPSGSAGVPGRAFVDQKLKGFTCVDDEWAPVDVNLSSYSKSLVKAPVLAVKKPKAVSAASPDSILAGPERVEKENKEPEASVAKLETAFESATIAPAAEKKEEPAAPALFAGFAPAVPVEAAEKAPLSFASFGTAAAEEVSDEDEEEDEEDGEWEEVDDDAEASDDAADEEADDIMAQLVELFKTENGREPTEEEVQQWMQTLKEAAEDGGLAL